MAVPAVCRVSHTAAVLCFAVRRMKQVLRIACSAPTRPQQQQRQFPLSSRPKSMFTGVACFVSRSGWFVKTHRRGNGELGDWGRRGKWTGDSAAGEWVR